jgi:hypothetical protein
LDTFGLKEIAFGGEKLQRRRTPFLTATPLTSKSLPSVENKVKKNPKNSWDGKGTSYPLVRIRRMTTESYKQR